MKKVTLSGEVGWDITYRGVESFLDSAKGEDIEVIISSPGGYVEDAFKIFNLFKNYPGKKKAILSGYVMSSASYISTAFDEIACEDNASYMIHNVRGGVWGDHNEILAMGNMAKGLSLVVAKQYSKKSGRPLDVISREMDLTTTFFSEEIIAAGFASEMVSTEGDKKSAEESKAVAMMAYKTVESKMFADQAKMKEDFSNAAFITLGTDNSAGNKEEPAQSQKKEVKMDLSKLKAEHPDLVQAIRDEEKVGFDAKLSEARALGATAERDRIKSVSEQSMPGFEDVVKTAMFDGKSGAGDVAIAIVAANKTALAKAKTAMTSDAPKPVDEPAGDEDGGLSKEDKLKAKWHKSASLRDEFGGDYDLFSAYYSETKGVSVKKMGGK